VHGYHLLTAILALQEIGKLDLSRQRGSLMR
jgi:hypothetical protein